MTHSAPASPCINVCVLDADRATCAGCRRTIDEIARWGRMSAAEQWRVVARLERERQTKLQQEQETSLAALGRECTPARAG